MKILTSLLIAGTLLFPGFTFAATLTPAQISTIKTEIIQLEAELAVLLGQSTIVEAGDTSATLLPSTSPLLTTPVSQSATLITVAKNAFPNAVFDIRFNVITGSSTIDVPDSAVGVSYAFSGINVSNPIETLKCPLVINFQGQAYCEVPPNTTQQWEVSVSIPTMGEIGSPTMSVNQMKYYTGLQTLSEAYNYYQPVGLQTSYLSVSP